MQLGTPRVGPGRWVPSHGLRCSSEPPPKSLISLRFTIQARIERIREEAEAEAARASRAKEEAEAVAAKRAADEAAQKAAAANKVG